MASHFIIMYSFNLLMLELVMYQIKRVVFNKNLLVNTCKPVAELVVLF